jgi:hypothetical protein
MPYQTADIAMLTTNALISDNSIPPSNVNFPAQTGTMPVLFLMCDTVHNTVLCVYIFQGVYKHCPLACFALSIPPRAHIAYTGAIPHDY